MKPVVTFTLMARPRRRTQFLLSAVVFGGGLAGSVLASALSGKGHPYAGIAVACTLFSAAMLVVFAGSFMKVQVADDGVTLAKWRASRFVPWPELRAIDPAHNAVVLSLHSGDRLALPFETRTRTAREARDAFVTQLREALASNLADPDDE
ncbi:MAG: hypothetical protein JWM74_1045 [Myxococcaceae bacterium]|nr:hypothetical protein [Myxococcaceae bacterium]